MAERTWVVHLVGFPAAGKRTVATALVAAAAERGHRFVLVDNHLTSNPVLAVLDHGGAGIVGQEVWDLVDEVREVVDRAIRELAAPDRSFVFTNAALADAPNGPRAAHRLARLAADRGATYVPVALHCEPEELLRRVPAADRAAHGKWVVPEEVAAHVAGRQPYLPDAPHLLVLDVTVTPPAEAAAAILRHLHAIEP